MWRERLRQSPSRAELAILIELQRRGLTTLLETQQPWTFDLKEDMVPGTTVDFFWHHPHRYAVFIDGPHHDKIRQGRKDEAINAALRNRGIRVQRLSYKVPLRKRRLREICDSIEKVLNHEG